MATPKNFILVINAGSATLKFKIFDCQQFKIQVEGEAEKIGSKGSFLHIQDFSNGSRRMIMKNYPDSLANTTEALQAVFGYIRHWKSKIEIIGHRVVHGGQQFKSPTIINKQVLSQLEEISQLAPLHNPSNLAAIKLSLKTFPETKNVAVFDTSYYKNVPDYAFLYAIPYKYYKDLGIRRYGFHGISHQWAVLKTAEISKKPLKKLKIISCHLGSGDSIAAVKYGTAIENSMGFTPLEGLTMSSRCGDIDPSVVFFLIRKLHLSVPEIEEILNNESGLKGIFGYSSDMRDVLVAAGYKVLGYNSSKKFSSEEKKQAKLALKMYVYDIVRYVGGYAAVLGGFDYLTFTGAIGYRSAIIRSLIIKELKRTFPKFKTAVVQTNEEFLIAKQSSQLIK